MISVIIPFYNAREYLKRCGESLKQKGDFEFLFIDDHSTDKGVEILSEIKDKRFKVLKNEHKKGVSGARNTGLDYATGEYVTFVDADDEILPNAYQMLSSVISEADANIYQFNHFRYYQKIGKQALKYTNPEGEYSSSNLPRMWNAVWNKIIKREFLKGIRFNEKIITGEDTLFILECLSKEDRIHHSLKAIYRRYFDNPESLSKIKTEKDLFKYLRELEAFIKKQKDPAIRTACCQMLSRDWASPTYLKLIGHA